MFIDIGFKDIELKERKRNIIIVNSDEPGTVHMLTKIKSSILNTNIRLSGYDSSMELCIKNRELYSTGDNVKPIVIIHDNLEDIEWIFEHQELTNIYCILVSKEKIENNNFWLSIEVIGRNKCLFEERRSYIDEDTDNSSSDSNLLQTIKEPFKSVENSADFIRSLSSIG